jgi:hypothetical protein
MHQAEYDRVRQARQARQDPGITITAPRTTSRDIRRHKASNYQPR